MALLVGEHYASRVELWVVSEKIAIGRWIHFHLAKHLRGYRSFSACIISQVKTDSHLSETQLKEICSFGGLEYEGDGT